MVASVCALQNLIFEIFTIFFPLGNKATGFFVPISLLAGVVGVITSLTGLSNVSQWNAPNLLAAADSSLVTLSLTIFAMGYTNYSSLFYFSDSTILEKLGNNTIRGYSN